MISIAAKLFLGSLLIVGITSVSFGVVGIRIIQDRVLAEAQQKVSNDLNAAREIYLGRLNHVADVVRFVADRTLLLSRLLQGEEDREAEAALLRLRERERLDLLVITDPAGRLRLRPGRGRGEGASPAEDEVLRAALERKVPVSATSLVPAEELRRESPELAQRAYFRFIDTPRARPRLEKEETAGMVLKAAAPVLDPQGKLIGAVCGGVLLNRNFEIVDKIKETVFQGVKYKDRDIGTATIFQDDVRISTNVRNADGTRAIGTRIAEDVYDRVVRQGRPWIDRAFVVNDWYITAYEPIRDLRDRIVGILYVGILERKYSDMRTRTAWTFVAISGGGAVLALGLSSLVSRTISRPLKSLAEASRAVAAGNLDVKVEVHSRDELRLLAETFNRMSSALKARDEQFKEFAKRKIMQSERLAFIGQLAAGVAHELNNPLQGIVTYSHLLLEESGEASPQRDLLEKIVRQANRCTSIIRGLLDFSRPKDSVKKPSDVRAILQECLSLVERQPLFHNIRVVREFPEEIPPVSADPSQIQQVFMNLIINAAEAMNGEGRLTLRIRFEAAVKAVEVEVEDTGHGIRPEHLDRIFDPFFTTKDVGHGTGLGLSICYGIVKGHGGEISVRSQEGEGSTFTVRLPVAEKAGPES